MKVGLLFKAQDPPDGKNIGRRWQEILAAAQVAEESGFDGVFLPEHHMMPDGYVPSQWGPLGALAALTERIDIGTTVHLLPFEHPIHVAEHSAMIDILSGGRLKLGVGMGNFPDEFLLYGLNPKTQVSRFEEAIDIVRRAWAGEQLDHEGKHFKIKGHITPLPESPELWMGAMSDPGVQRAARLGAVWATDPLHNVDVMKRWTDIYHEAGDEHGTRDDLGVVLLRDGWVADSLADVERVWWPCIRQEHWFYFEKVPRWVAELEPFVADIKSEDDFQFDRHRIDRLIVGSPEECIEQIERFKEVIGMDYLIMSLREAHGPSHEEELECIRRFGQEVIPAVR
jgi:alkanesulfonate monooxygenase SsuD/methylene tetrahydromethanopterin reductase-like flavin-dependent oxidoreductase (luciferase family)